LLGRLNNRLIYVLAILATVVPLVLPLGFPLSISNESTQAFEVLKEIPQNSVILVGLDFNPGASAELEPQAIAVLNYLADKDVKIVAITSSVQAARYPDSCSKETYGAKGKEYGKDYVSLGYYAGSEASLSAFCQDIRSVYKADSRGTPIDSLPLMQGITGIKDFDMVITFNSMSGGNINTSTDMYVRQVNVTHDIQMLVGTQAVSAPNFMPYLGSKNIRGLLSGLKGAAEIEILSDTRGNAVRSMDALTVGSLLIVALLVAGNLGYLAERRDSEGGH